MTNRRKFLEKSLLTIPFLNTINVFGQTAIKKPIVISTWDSGIPVNEAAMSILKEPKGRALDAVEKGANQIENTINCCVGLGGNPDREGKVTLDACIMDEHMNCGGVAFMENIKHPISVARKVMEDTPHVLLVGEGARQFAIEKGFKVETDELSEDARKSYENWLKKSEYKPIKNIELEQKKAFDKGKGPSAPQFLENGDFNHDTMALLALDHSGNISGACTTSGMGFKMRGRVGDSPIIGAGLYVDNEVGACTGSGQGEEVIRIAGAAMVVEFMRQGKSPEMACRLAIERLVKINPKKARDFQVGFIALNKKGQYGSYAVNPGFVFSVTTAPGNGRVIKAKSYFS
ncbi:MAG: N(4)-(beta-N-acetylglucosaminyl)-L-asparaginase [Cytophagaceae bacterium]|nr:N(4)-(beta-N-acetylglucosaminyl)-L-asparaginase [Cytophagaceae bacterium]MBK9508050.1 N(4)-(beta-N-acetylglucosaminyl)-L-asparaginase [Cytophagaceae bacterium]MBK9936456.1 N(4)-(beta-N-acetylglucosaminyl)-L-asparaginase [Cytophagaceae bacterium]MBL0300205.1 N(4)-(beta-N-acetylglucosaminyl)-L-asparaginase [Cytophagaceae bacterium]MBL0327142.1 N(4)-(beta-N-acetylglucosaminyl)-L-asparaginase [Cytophagaceae bacterium]